MAAQDSYKIQMKSVYKDEDMNVCNGLSGELILLDFISAFAVVKRTERISRWHAVDMYFTPVESKYGFLKGESYHCQCKTALSYDKYNCWSVSFKDTGIGIQRFLNSQFPILITNTHTIDRWKNVYDGKILRINTDLLKKTYDPKKQESLVIPRDPKYFEVLEDLTETQKMLLRITSSSTYTY